VADDVDTVELLLRLVSSLAVVLALVGAATWALRRSGGLRRLGGIGRSGPGVTVQVVDRVGVAKGATVALVRVGGRTMVVGATEREVTLLAEAPELATRLDLEEAERAAPAPAQDVELDTTSAPAGPLGPPRPARTGLMEALREATVRRS
jgi:flagellar biogenesis protein FliO